MKKTIQPIRVSQVLTTSLHRERFRRCGIAIVLIAILSPALLITNAKEVNGDETMSWTIIPQSEFNGPSVTYTAIRGGWLVRAVQALKSNPEDRLSDFAGIGLGLAFIPDPDHKNPPWPP